MASGTVKRQGCWSRGLIPGKARNEVGNTGRDLISKSPTEELDFIL